MGKAEQEGWGFEEVPGGGGSGARVAVDGWGDVSVKGAGRAVRAEDAWPGHSCGGGWVDGKGRWRGFYWLHLLFAVWTKVGSESKKSFASLGICVGGDAGPMLRRPGKIVVCSASNDKLFVC